MNAHARSRLLWSTCALAAIAFVALTAAGPGTALTVAPQGRDPACARVTAAAPRHVDGRERDEGAVPGVATWGHGAIALRCGLPPIPPTPDPCVDVDGVHWVLDQARSREGRKVVVTYGRTPAVEVTMSGQVAAIDEVLVEMSAAVEPVPQKRRCVAIG